MSRKFSDDYLKVIEWSEEDQCYIGTAPGLIVGGVHGKNQAKVFKDICGMVQETIDVFLKEGKPLPPETANKKFSGKIALRISPDLHKNLAIKAKLHGESVNKFIQKQLEARIKLSY
jgi:predicted HicB family RNase H-like nuclease